MRTFHVQLLICLVLSFAVSESLHAAVPAEGTLFVIGGALRPDNAAVFRRLTAAGGGPTTCRVAIFRTASVGLRSSERIKATLQNYDVAADAISLVDLRPDNAATMAYDARLVEQLGACNMAFFVGGDQQRITDSLLTKDGGDTPVLTALRELHRRGGVIAGSSAGAAMQSKLMIAVGGLPDAAPDEGMDALDFGLSGLKQRRGLTVGPGLGFFEHGIIDQHFGQRRNRLGRLARAAAEHKARWGFGVDENTAIVVSSRGVEVVGPGCVTIVDAADAECSDGPLGCRIAGLRISCLQSGDGFDPASGKIQIHPARQPVVIDKESGRGNYLIPDIASVDAVSRALINGLAENTSQQQVGVTLRYAQSFGHGYRFVFRKSGRTQSWSGSVENWPATSVKDVDLSIEPILASLQSPAAALPVDLPSGDASAACQACWFRGILLADDQRRLRPEAAITRAELAVMIAHSVHLLPPFEIPPPPVDVPADAPWLDELTRVLNAKLLEVDQAGKFSPDAVVRRQDAAVLFERLREHNGSKTVAAPLTRPDDALSRQEAAQAVNEILAFDWK